ncbi:hypothetical protein Nepgr_007613 [Nepenthes gracilis]|uniref:Uncharacterized protein n=1 Tax=Nepenthes gracilis TaxID=150966 RepID=A0AAD3XIG6_NEPGR|nr:hypothetical protein Nepgr_007613 [Nepenthes gracilis]
MLCLGRRRELKKMKYETEGEARVTAEQACFLSCTDDGIPIIGEIPGLRDALLEPVTAVGISTPPPPCRLVKVYFGWPGASSRP